MLEFKVGEAFPLELMEHLKGAGGYSEGAFFSVEPYTCFLIYCFDSPTEEEIGEFKKGTAELSVTELRGVLFIQSKFGRLHRADAAYSTHLSKRRKELPELSEGHKGYSVDAFLVDTRTGVLTAHRLFRMTPDFSRRFRMLLFDDMERSLTKEGFEEAVRSVYENYGSEALFKRKLIHMKSQEKAEGTA